MESEDCNLLVLTIKECFLYKIPPLRTSAGHRAEDWDLQNPLFVGCLRIYRGNKGIRIVVYSFIDKSSSNTNEDNIKFFGDCYFEISPNDTLEGHVAEVLDSSRYFALKLKGSNKQQALLGIGFQDRDVAFDFRNTLNEYVRFVNRMSQTIDVSGCSKAPVKPKTSNNEFHFSDDFSDDLSQEATTAPVDSNPRTFAFDSGKKISINSKIFKNKNKVEEHSSAAEIDEDEEWGDFQ